MFDRSQSGYALTESGEAIRQKAEEVEEAVLSLERAAFGRDLRASGKVRIATADDIASFIIAPKLPTFRQAHPAIVLEVVSSWDVANLTRREADVALRTARPTHGDYVIRQAGTWMCAVYASRSFVHAHKLSEGMDAIPDVDVITWTEEHRFRGGDWFEIHLVRRPSSSLQTRGTFSMRLARRGWGQRSCRASQPIPIRLRTPRASQVAKDAVYK